MFLFVFPSTIGDMAFNLADKADERAVQYWNLLLILLYAFVFLVGMFGNSLVIYVVLRYSKMQTVTNMYIFNLAIADEMFLIGLLFLIITVINKQWLFGRVWCKVYLSITSINQVTSSFLLMVMSFDRYLAVCHPIIAPKYRTPFLAKFICLTVWAVSHLSLSCPPLVLIHPFATQGGRNSDGAHLHVRRCSRNQKR